MDKFTLSNHDSAILDGVGWVCLDANLWQLSSSIFSPFRDATMRSVHTTQNRSLQSFGKRSWVYKPNPRSRKIVSVALHEFPLTQICDTNFHFWARIWLRMRSKSSQIWERARAYQWVTTRLGFWNRFLDTRLNWSVTKQIHAFTTQSTAVLLMQSQLKNDQILHSGFYEHIFWLNWYSFCKL